MGKPLFVSLTDEQREHLHQLTRSGNAPARVQTRARILLLADRNPNTVRQGEQNTHRQITDSLSISGQTISTICRRFVLEGMEAALTFPAFYGHSVKQESSSIVARSPRTQRG